LKGIIRSGLLLGFALGGFFDGVLLHQILQWHHLLSLVDGVRDQILFDGLFHGAMYLVALAGGVLLVRRRASLVQPQAGARLLGAALIGFGAWHVTDTVLSHWLLGIHRIRIASPDPLFWDLLWLAVFGLAPLALGFGMRRGSGPGGHVTALALAGLAVATGSWAAWPPADDGSTLVVFRPGLSMGAELNALLRAGAAPLSAKQGVWVVRWTGERSLGRLYAGGALLVGASPVGAGCLTWMRA
jgi:uncharacterized membrane protein